MDADGSPHEPPPAANQRGRSPIRGIVWFIIFVPIAYVLSLGPVFRFLPANRSLHYVYMPLIEAEAHCRPLDTFVCEGYRLKFPRPPGRLVSLTYQFLAPSQQTVG